MSSVEPVWSKLRQFAPLKPRTLAEEHPFTWLPNCFRWTYLVDSGATQSVWYLVVLHGYVHAAKTCPRVSLSSWNRETPPDDVRNVQERGSQSIDQQAVANFFWRFQATTWLMLEQVFEKCADFDSTNKIKASYLVETFDHTLIRRSSLQKHITCWEHFCWATTCCRECHSYVKRSFGSCNKLLLFHVGAHCWTHFGWKGEMATFPASTLL